MAKQYKTTPDEVDSTVKLQEPGGDEFKAEGGGRAELLV